MKKFKYLAILVVLIALSGSCTKRVTPASGLRLSKEEATTRYEYYYVEGLRNKLTGSLSSAISLFEECIKIAPERDGAYYQIAQIGYATGSYNDAKGYAVKALSLSDNIWYYSLVANIHYKLGNIDSAIVVNEAAQKIYPNNQDLRFTLGNLYFEAEQYEKAISVFEEIDSEYGTESGSAMQLIQSLIKTGRLAEAEKKLLEMIELFPDDNTYVGLLAEFYRDRGDLEKASGVYEKLFLDAPDDPRVLSSLVNFYRTGDRFKEMFGLLNTIAFSSTVAVEEKVNIFAQLLDDKVIIASYDKEYEMALMILEAAHEDVGVVHLLRPELFQITGRQKEAIEILTTVVLRWSDLYYAHERLLLLYLGARDYEHLYAASSTAVRRFNTALIPRLLYASAAIELGFYDEALEQLGKARMVSNENIEIVIQILATEADAYYRKGESEKAFDKFAEALQLRPDDNLVLNNYAYFLAEKDTRLKDAEKMIEKVILSEPTNNTYLDTQAWVFYKLKKYKKAEAVMLLILNSGEKEDAEYYDHYGFILKGRNKCEQAVISWNKALELDNSKENLIKEIEKCVKGP